MKASSYRSLLSVLILPIIVLLTIQLLPGSDPVPGRPHNGPVAIIGATVHPIDSPPIENATVVFLNGRITEITSSEIQLPENTLKISAEGKHVYPGLIAPSTQLGLIEIGSVRATRDQIEVGSMNPNVRAEISVNPDSEHIPVARSNGIALAVTRPAGGRISGTSALLRLDGWTWEDLTIEAPLGLEVQWPYLASGRRGRWGGGRRGVNPQRAAREREIILAAIDETFATAESYVRARPNAADGSIDGEAPDLRMEALRPVVNGEIPVFLHAQDERQIRSSVEWAIGRGLKPIIVGGRDAANVAEFLASRQVPVIYGPIHQLPSRRDEEYYAPFMAPARLQEAGVQFAIGAFDTSNVRNLPYHAGTAVAFGLSSEEAIRSITLTPAEILGVADRYGSITPGKSATLIITDGDPLQITTQVEAMWIDGAPVDLRNKQTKLYGKYSEKLDRVQEKSRF